MNGAAFFRLSILADDATRVENDKTAEHHRNSEGKSVCASTPLRASAGRAAGVPSTAQGNGERRSDTTQIRERCKEPGQATVQATAHDFPATKSAGGNEQGRGVERSSGNLSCNHV